MKKVVFVILICLFQFYGIDFAMGQTKLPSPKQEEKPVIIRDRFMFDFHHSFWMNAPQRIMPQKFNPGFTLSGMWDFLLPHKSPISFGLGVGFSYYTLYSDAMLKSDALRSMQFYVIPDEVTFSVSKVTYNNVNIPFEVRYRHRSGFKFSVGMRLGLTTGISYRYKGYDPSGSGVKINYKSYEVFNKAKFNYDIYVRTGWKAVGGYFSYQVTKLFDANKGPQIYPMTVGITVNFF